LFYIKPTSYHGRRLNGHVYNFPELVYNKEYTIVQNFRCSVKSSTVKCCLIIWWLLVSITKP